MSFTYYKEKIVTRESDFYYSWLFTPETQRDGLIALYNVEKELQQITELYAEKNMAQVKLQWWQQEWQRMLQQQAQHPLTRVLQTFVDKLPASLLQEWIEGCLIKLDCDHLCTEQDLTFFCYRETGIRALLLAHIVGFNQHQSLKGVQDLAEVTALLSIITHRVNHIKKGQFFLPLVWLEQYHVTAEELATLKMTPHIIHLFNQVVATAELKFKSGLEKIAPEDKTTLLPLIIEAKLAQQTLKKLAKHNFILSPIITVMPIFKLMTAYKLYLTV